MAPLQPSHRSTKPLRSILKIPSQPAASAPTNTSTFFATSKKDKRRIKHAQLLNKISKPTGKQKRRRPNKKLVATLDELVDALPDVLDAENDLDKGQREGRGVDQVNVIKRRSLKSRPGALKRKQRLDNEERERFRRNMAQMTATNIRNEEGATATQVERQAGLGRWKALRGFIEQTLEKRTDIAMINEKT